MDKRLMQMIQKDLEDYGRRSFENGLTTGLFLALVFWGIWALLAS